MATDGKLIVDIISASIAALALLLGGRAELRSRQERKHRGLQESAIAYSALDQILSVGKDLPIQCPDDLVPSKLAAANPQLATVAKMCRDCIKDVVPAFPEISLALGQLAIRCGKMSDIGTYSVDDVLDRMWLVRQWRGIYQDMVELSLEAAWRDSLRDHYPAPTRLFDTDPYISMMHGRFMSFARYVLAHGEESIRIEVCTGRRSQYE